jgi:predicted nucleic acid-binding protein
LNDVFVDTSGWASLFVASEPFHQKAVRHIFAVRQAGRRSVTTNYFLAEFSALLMSPLRIEGKVRLALLDRIRTADWVEVLHVDPSLDAASWEYLRSGTDKDFSLVDCSSFVVIQQSGVRESLTTDRHFEQAGFIRVLK